MVTGVHILLTYKCTNQCDHCFLHCAPECRGTFTVWQLRTLVRDIETIGSVDEVYFEGGEPFLFYTTLIEGVRMTRAAGLRVGIVTNGYWAVSKQDARRCLTPLYQLGIFDFSVSDDEFHRGTDCEGPAKVAIGAATELGIAASSICIEPPKAVAAGRDGAKGQPATGGSVLFKGRAAERLTAGLPARPAAEFTTCPHEDLADPERVHVDAYGNVHVCQGISIGNMWERPLPEILAGYEPLTHPITGPILRGGPLRLAEEHALDLCGDFVDECHFCYFARKALRARFPEWLAPSQVYGRCGGDPNADRKDR